MGNERALGGTALLLRGEYSKDAGRFSTVTKGM